MKVRKPFASLAWPGLLACAASAAPPAVVLIKNGPSSNRIDVAYVSEGYTSQELGRFAATVKEAVQYKDTATLAQPYKRYRKFFNYYRVDLPSPQSGIDEPEKGIFRNTALDGEGRGRRGLVNQQKAEAAVASAMQGAAAKADWISAVLNTDGYYNSGGPVCVFSYPNFSEIALHEGGHSFHGLADEYGGPGVYSGPEAKEINVSKDPAAFKWAHWIGFRQPLVGSIGAYQGARYFDQGIYRPASNSKMGQTSHNLPQPFNMPSVEKIVQDIYAQVRPLDGWRDNRTRLVDPESLWVRTVDPSVVWVDWYVDGRVIRRNAGESFRPHQHGLSSGIHYVRAVAYDEVMIHANSDNANPHPLDMVRTGLDALRQDVEWVVEIRRVLGGPNSLAPALAPALIRQGRLVFDLPREGAYRLGIYTAEGILLDVLRGSGRKGANALPWAARQDRGREPIFLRVETPSRK